MANTDPTLEYRIKPADSGVCLVLDPNSGLVSTVAVKHKDPIPDNQKWKISNESNVLKIKSFVGEFYMSTSGLAVKCVKDNSSHCTLNRIDIDNEYIIKSDTGIIGIRSPSDTKLEVLSGEAVDLRCQRWVLEIASARTVHKFTVPGSDKGKRIYTRQDNGLIHCQAWTSSGIPSGSADGLVLVREEIPRVNTPMAVVAWGGVNKSDEIRLYFVNTRDILEDKVRKERGKWTNGDLFKKKFIVDHDSTLKATESGDNIILEFKSGGSSKKETIPK